MKRNITFRLKTIENDWNIKKPRLLIDRIDKCFKLIGDIVVGNKLAMYFEDGYTFKTEGLDMQGYITKHDNEGNLELVTLCTKNLAFELEVVKKKVKFKENKQLKLDV